MQLAIMLSTFTSFLNQKAPTIINSFDRPFFNIVAKDDLFFRDKKTEGVDLKPFQIYTLFVSL